MIVFLNFAPIEFLGGAERWMLDVSSAVSKIEKVTVIDVHTSISSVYGKLVLKHPFNKRVPIDSNREIKNHISLKLISFIPFTTGWKQTRKALTEARFIYFKFELLETLIILYFGGISSLKKTIAGIHSPFLYQSPETFFDYLHNFIYRSYLSMLVLSNVDKVHVLNPFDEKLFIDKFHLVNVIRIPNFIDISKTYKWQIENEENLNIAFVGELNLRKGADILIKTIKISPENYIFHIAGDGVFKEEIKSLSKQKNVIFYGYLSDEELHKLYSSCEVLFFPSRAESFSLVLLEAMSHGLTIVSSIESDLELPSYIQKINKSRKVERYLQLFKQEHLNNHNDLESENRIKIQNYAKTNFNKEILMPKLISQLFSV